MFRRAFITSSFAFILFFSSSFAINCYLTYSETGPCSPRLDTCLWTMRSKPYGGGGSPHYMCVPSPPRLGCFRSDGTEVAPSTDDQMDVTCYCQCDGCNNDVISVKICFDHYKPNTTTTINQGIRTQALKHSINEVKLLHSLEHDNIIKFVGCYWDSKQFIILTQLMEGSIETLLISNGALTEPQMLHFTTQTATGLDFLHGRSPPIIHRDIKCSNLLLDKKGNVKLADFGISLIIALKDDVTRTTQQTEGWPNFRGTILFAAPEVRTNIFAGQAVAYGRKADVWSLACAIVEMLTTKPPYYAQFTHIGLHAFMSLSVSNINRFPYSGNLIPARFSRTRRLLDIMFIIDCKRRPRIRDCLQQFHLSMKSNNVLTMLPCKGVVDGCYGTVDVDGSGAFFYTIGPAHGRLQHVCFVTGAHTRLSIEVPQVALEPHIFLNIDSVVVGDASTKQLLLVIPYKLMCTGGITIATFWPNLAQRRAVLFEEKPTRLIMPPVKQSFCHLLRSEDANLYLCTYWIDEAKNETQYSLSRLQFDHCGYHMCSSLTKDMTIGGLLTRPFVAGQRLYFLTLDANKMMLLSITLDGLMMTTSELSGQENVTFGQRGCCKLDFPQLISDIRAVFCLHSLSENINVVVELCLTTRRWKRLADHRGHTLKKYIRVLLAADETIYIHGQCDEETCIDKAHILRFVIPFMPMRFEHKEKLGAGGFGMVYKCWDRDNHRFFVTKETLLNTVESQKIAQKEVNTLTSLCHPLIVAYYGCRMKGDKIVIFMEYMAAGSLANMIEKHGVISEQKAIDYIGQIVDGLIYVHERDIIHSDLKCSNLLLHGNGKLKLADFGDTADYTSQLLTVAGERGTLYWTAPEVLRGEGVSRESDLWSLGITVIEMLVGKPPYSTLPGRRFFVEHFSDRLKYEPDELVPNASDPMKQFLGRLLEPDERWRPDNGGDLQRIVFALLLGAMRIEKRLRGD